MFIKSLLLLVVSILPIIACSEKEFTKDPSESYTIAKEPYDSGDYEIALSKLGEFKSRFPYSQFAIEAELLIANSHFELEHYEEAANAYAQFAKLHPKHSKVNFAMFRVGESYWKLSPDSVDREQDFTIKAVEEWEKLIAKNPDSKYSKDAKRLVKEGHRRLAESVEFIADFYCKLDIYDACAYRFMALSKSFPQFTELRFKSLSKAADALEEVAKIKDIDPKSDKNIYVNTMSKDQILALARKLRGEAADVSKVKK
jgi:outer membrane protein assembly factor BamD